MKKFFILLLLAFFNIGTCFASNSASVVFSINIPQYISITPLTNTTLTAHVQDGVVINPLQVRYRVISNSIENTLYLTSKSMVDGTLECSMFKHGGTVYIAFSSITNPPSHQNLLDAKINLKAPNIIVLPLISITGVKSQFKNNKYEIHIENDTYYINVNVGLNPPIKTNTNGIYQATLFLTEADI